MGIEHEVKMGDRVSYEDMANPRTFGTVEDSPAARRLGEFMVKWEDGSVSYSDLRQAGWRLEPTFCLCGDVLVRSDLGWGHQSSPYQDHPAEVSPCQDQTHHRIYASTGARCACFPPNRWQLAAQKASEVSA